MEHTNFGMVQDKLIIHEKYNEMNSALITANIFTHFSVEAVKAVIDWAYDRDISFYTVNEATAYDFAEELECSVFQAICFMNALNKDDEIFMDAILHKRKDMIE